MLFFFQSTFSKLVPLVDHSLRNRSLAMNLGYLGAMGPSVAPKAASSGIPQLGSFQSGTIGGRLLGATATATTVSSTASPGDLGVKRIPFEIDDGHQDDRKELGGVLENLPAAAVSESRN